MAGRRAGATDKRDLWPDRRRIISEMGPYGVLVENVSGLFVNGTEELVNPASQAPQIGYIKYPTAAYGLQILGELQDMGYCVVSFTLSAAEVGAPHRRDRRFILGIMANSNNRHSDQEQTLRTGRNPSKYGRAEMGDTYRQRQQEYSSTKPTYQRSRWQESQCSDWWKVEPDVGRVANGVPFRVDRIKALENAVVPQVAKRVAEKILEIIHEMNTTNDCPKSVHDLF